MKASELRAGQWFETMTRKPVRRGLCVEAADKCGEILAYLHGYSYQTQRLDDEEVTPLPDCTGWDWQPPAPEPVAESYAERQAAWVKSHGIAVGSRVRVVREPKEGEQWPGLEWYSEMSKYVGRIGKVTAVSPFSVSVCLGDTDMWCLPYFVLEPVAPTPEPLQVREPTYEWLLAYYEANEVFASQLGSAMDVFENHFDEQGKLIGSGKWRLDELGKALVWVREATKGFVNRMNTDAETPPPEQAETKRYSSVVEMVRDISGDEFAAKVQQKIDDSAAVTQRIIQEHRARNGDMGNPILEHSPVMVSPDKAEVEAIDPGEGYRLLAKDEPVQEGDEVFNSFLHEWHQSNNWRTNDKQARTAYRRRISPAPEAKSAEAYRPFDNTRFVRCLLKAIHRQMPKSLPEVEALRAIENVFVAAFTTYESGVRCDQARDGGM